MLWRILRNPFLWVGILLCPDLIGQGNPDTLKISIEDAEKIFLQKNLNILAAQYNVNIANALVQQAKVWDNPVISLDQNVYDGKFFRHTRDKGQVYVQIQQLIRTAGKIKKQTQLAQDNTLTATDQLNDMVRKLRFALYTDMNNLAQLQNTALLLKSQVSTMKNLSKGMDEMFKIGNISEKENLRIKALLFSLQNDLNDNYKQQYDLQKELSDLLQINENNFIVVEDDTKKMISEDEVRSISLAALKDSALRNRPDIQNAQHTQLYQQHNVAYQKSLAVPDITIGPSYDRRNSYVPNYFGLSVSIPIPLFNRNKGNIRAAEIAATQAGVQRQQVENLVLREVQTAYLKLANATSLMGADNQQFKSNYDNLLRNMLTSYRARQISLIEFVDFFESYTAMRIKQNQIITHQKNAAAELNYTVNKSIIKF